MIVPVENVLHVALRATFKTLAFLFAVSAAVFSASAGYGLLRMLAAAVGRGADIGLAELAAHSGLIVIFFLLSGLGVYGARKCFS